MKKSFFANMPKLGVNIDHVATLRQARRGEFPDPVEAALACERAGADSIVAHLREDRRHIQDKDLLRLKRSIKARLNLEMSIAEDIVRFALKLKPEQATLVPEKRQELTTEGGLDLLFNFRKVEKAVKRLAAAGVEVSIFIDPDLNQIAAALDCGARIIEIHTGCYAAAKTADNLKKAFGEVKAASIFAAKLSLQVNAGHGLDYSNAARIAKIKDINELNIGYSIISRSLFVGLEKAVREMRGLIS